MKICLYSYFPSGLIYGTGCLDPPPPLCPCFSVSSYLYSVYKPVLCLNKRFEHMFKNVFFVFLYDFKYSIESKTKKFRFYSPSAFLNYQKNLCTTHSKIGGLFMFQKVLIKMVPAHLYLPFENESYVPVWIIYEF